jgi:predicted Fe-Mo cluster-binding NifX family protein
MIIAYAAMEPVPNALIAVHSARAGFFLLVDEQGQMIETLVNPFAQVERGAAPLVAQFLADKGVGKLIAGEFGSRFVSELEEKGIDYAWMNGLVSDAIKALTG